MMTIEEKNKIRKILAEGLNINPNINFSYFLDEIDETNTKVKSLDSKLSLIINNQRILDAKLDRIINILGDKLN